MGGVACTAAYGYRVVAYNNTLTEGSVKKAFAVEINTVDGFDMHTIAASHSAIWLADTHKILLDTAGTRAIAYASSSVSYSVAGVTVFSLSDAGQAGFANAVSATSFVPTFTAVPVDGMYLPAAHTVGIAVNSVGKLFIDTNGVGIGAATVASVQLQITDATNAQFRLTCTADLRMGASSTGAIFGTYSAHDLVAFRNGAEVGRFDGAGLNLVTAKVFKINSVQVLGARDTGWAAMTGTTNKATVYDTSTVTLAQLAGRVMALQAALTTHGAIGT